MMVRMVTSDPKYLSQSLAIPLIVSLVDGYALPLRVDNNVGCGVPGCEVDLGPDCIPLRCFKIEQPS